MTSAEIFNTLFNSGKYTLPYLIKLSHPELDTLYFTNNNQKITFENHEYECAKFDYTRPNNMLENGSLSISAIDNFEIFNFAENADERYSLEVVGVIAEDGAVQKLRAYKHFYGSLSYSEDMTIVFNLGKDDRLEMTFIPYTYDTENNPGNA